ncbi:type VI secretion system lipoprotein TssJ [Diaphorobacter aerolatus]|uniref:Type VI secretion system lipoprotein TssJ n=1 Tax=Diaphorobacter aerolatus TaxID=1288495 RepID=A0A7H0GLB9_9BURK|nr:type VI secretion system lipoprotein TssJ [Diaphorobacter aerolatus]QNP49085.1 type VI secretion system lipoprotein TssJ [Diaphorobacter aerolatus]
MKKLLTGLVLLGTSLLLAGCAGPRASMPAPYTVVITADEALNPDRNGKAAPVQVKVYRLRGMSAFSTADFFTLYEKDDQILGSELVSKETITLQPGEAKVLLGKASGDERLLGVFVAYRDLDKAVWRGIAPLPAPKELGRFAVFQPSFDTAIVKVAVGPNKVTVTSNVQEVPVPTGGFGEAACPSCREAFRYRFDDVGVLIRNY